MFKYLAIIFFAICSGASFGEDFVSSTIYHIKNIKLEEDDNCARHSIFDLDGNVLFDVCKKDYNACLLEATCAVNALDENDNLQTTMLNYTEVKSGKARFKDLSETNCPFGIGVRADLCLDPFYTVAADLSSGLHKPGEVIFIPKIKGLILPNGKPHTGYFIVRDTGNAIRGQNRFDFYTGTIELYDPRNSFTKIGLAKSTSKFSYQVITGELADKVRRSRNYPGLPLNDIVTALPLMDDSGLGISDLKLLKK